MIIVADIGNTYLKMARWNGERLSHHVRVRHRELLGSDWQATLEDSAKITSDGVFVASVADETVEQLFEAWLLSRGHAPPVYLSSTREACGLRNAYVRPETLGIDRWCAMIAARAQHKGPLCVVDAGTAVTIDWVDARGEHRGGMIMPGSHLQAESLFTGTRHVHESSKAPGQLFADNTADAVVAGVCHACAALVERAYGEISSQCAAAPRLFVTGGETDRVVPLVAMEVDEQPDLVLLGVALLAEEPQR